MSGALAGRRRSLRALFPLDDNGLELLVLPGADPARNPPGLPLPAAGLPARIAERVILLRFVIPEHVDALTPAQISVTGATVRWSATVPGLPALTGADAALQPDEIAWFDDLVAAVAADPGHADRWLVVHTEVDTPATVALRIQEDVDDETTPAGFEPRLAALSVDRDGAFASSAAASWLNGISHAVVVDQHPLISERLRQRVILVCFENAFGITDLRRQHVTIDGGVRVPTVPVRWVWPLATIDRVGDIDPELTVPEQTELQAIAAAREAVGNVDRWIVVCTQERGDFSSYRLRIAGDPRFDPLLSAVAIEFKIECPASLDCRVEETCPDEPSAAPDLDYLTRDFAGFRRLILDRLAVLGAADAEQNAVGLWSVLAELIAARADELAYAQDAVATEAYLHSARLRSSVRRHARMLDYRLHEGVNARAWVHLSAAAGEDRADAVAVGDLFVTRLVGADAVLPPSILDTALPLETQVFHALLPLRRLSARHNAIDVYAWGEDDLCLPRATTRCTLHDPAGGLDLRDGDVIVLEAVASASTGRPEDADPTLRHVARIAGEPVHARDTLLGDDVLEVEWQPEDALPFDLPVRQQGRVLAVARANLVLVAHGRPAQEEIRATAWGSRGRLRARVSRRGLTWATRPPRWDGAWAASAIVRQSAADALPDITLLGLDDDRTWHPQRDLLASDRSAAEFCVEMETSGEAWIRFGDDTTGRSPVPGAQFRAAYRTGNGTSGNVGADAIAHLLSSGLPASAVLGIRNPRPAEGGLEPESLAHARAAAPYAFRRQERAVTLEDWAEMAARSDEVQRAVATLRWSGSWHTVRVHADPVEGKPADRAFVDRMTAHLDRYRLAGYDLEVVGPTYVPLDIVLSVHPRADAWPEAVAGALQEAFGTGSLPDGTQAFFHPDNFTFGDSVFLSQIVARAMAIPGVRWVDTRRENPKNRFRRWSSTAPDELESGVLRMGGLEVARCDSDPSVPERGRVLFLVEGGA